MYYRDRNIWVGTNREANSLPLQSLIQLYGAYYRDTPTTFRRIKDKTGREELQSRLAKHSINVRVTSVDNTGKPLTFTFVDDKDHFLFNLKFGAYRY